ncbi:MAG: CopD family protein [Alphaproteobacteria bacterium]|nr:CopD family protein [Alphaproteobacteria bacterium]
MTLPPFELGTGGLLLDAVRAVAVAGLLSAFGSLLFLLGQGRSSVERPIRHVGWASLAVAAAGLIVWVVLESATLAGWDQAFAALPEVLWNTEFGHLAGWQALALAIAAIGLACRFGWLAATAAGVGVILETGRLHAWAMQPSITPLLVSEALHLLAAGAWLGGLLPLRIVVRSAPLDEAIAASRRFSRMATVAVLVLAATAFWQGWVLSGGWPGLAGTAFGWMELAKLVLFLALLACAGFNRFRFTPALAGADAARGRRALGRSIAIETALGVLVVCAAAVLTSLPPGMHVQPVWPFPMRPSLTIVNADPGFRREVADAVLAMVGALVLVGLGIVVRWIRWIAWLAAVVIAWFALPHFDLLFVEAYPTSFYHSPTGFAATSIADGAALYPQHCASCHGAEGRGDGPAARGLRIPPADLTAEHLWAHSDGEMFWWLSHGIVSAEGEVAMPGFSGTLTDQQIWHLIDYVRANNAGITERTTGAWTPPVQAPGLNASCPEGRTLTLAALRGQVVRVVFGASPFPQPQHASAATILLVPPDAPAPPEYCIARDPAAARAYAIVTGSRDRPPVGTEILIDANGWLRAALAPGEEGELAAEIKRIAAAPLPPHAGGMENMHHH